MSASMQVAIHPVHVGVVHVRERQTPWRDAVRGVSDLGLLHHPFQRTAYLNPLTGCLIHSTHRAQHRVGIPASTFVLGVEFRSPLPPLTASGARRRPTVCGSPPRDLKPIGHLSQHHPPNYREPMVIVIAPPAGSTQRGLQASSTHFNSSSASTSLDRSNRAMLLFSSQHESSRHQSNDP